MNHNTSYDFSYTLGKAIPLFDTKGNRLQKKRIYDLIELQVRSQGDRYQDAVIKGVFLNIYYKDNDSLKVLDFTTMCDYDDMIHQIIKEMESYIISAYLPEAKSLINRPIRIPSKINQIKGNIQERRPFIVGDIETVMVNNVHVPYAAGYLSDLYESRLEAKKRGDEPMTLIYKIIMNSLYGRFGINPESTVTEICNQKRYDELFQMDNFQSAEKLTDHYYIVNYITNSSLVDDANWKAPKMSAVHLAAAITACARIHMYPHISRPDCYYTDTDSIVLGSPLSDDLISSTEMGKFKLEYRVKRGIFLAPKTYSLLTEDENQIIKHKGPAKDFVTSEWFLKQFADPSQTELITMNQNFRIDWKKLLIIKKDMIIRLGLPQSSKRENVYDENNVWIDTRSIR
uniref:DNA-directed DNA polymerase n=1 Tax=Mirabilis himalaica TaxID=482968 RepID=A0A6M9TUG2_9CARY|nr:uncharacterized protein [Mirabilis himalaica]QKN19338.1 uncharacterized protein [Mirabilis himalaica]